MDRDDLDDRVRQAATPEPAVVERVVRAVLTSAGGGSASWDEAAPGMLVRTWPRAFAMLTACLVAAVALGVWWCARQPAAVADGVYRVQATTEVAPEGVYRADANPSVAPDGPYPADPNRSVGRFRVIRVTTAEGATWIFSTAPDDDSMPSGRRVVVGGEAR